MIGPVPFDTEAHSTASFDCGVEGLDRFLKERAAKNIVGGGSVTWVVLDNGQEVIAYYAAATGSALHGEVSGRVRRNQPQPIPALVLGRLAVDTRHQGKRLGAALLRHFLQKVIEISATVGVRLVVVHAKNDEARDFYLKYGFSPSPVDEFVLHLLVQDLRASLS